MLTVKSDYHKMESYAKKKPIICGIIVFGVLAGNFINYK